MLSSARHISCVLGLALCLVLPTKGEAQDITVFTHNSEAYSFTDNNHELRGLPKSGNRAFFIELVREMMKEMGHKKFPITDVSFKRGYHNLKNKPKIALFNIARTPARESMFKWVGTIWKFHDHFLKHSGSDLMINRIEDALHLKICVVRGNVHDQLLTQMGFKNIVRVNQYETCMKRLVNKRIDLTASSLSSLRQKAQSAKISLADIEVTRVVLTSHGGYIGFSNDVPDKVIQTWQDALDKIKSDGRYNSLKKTYYTEPPLKFSR